MRDHRCVGAWQPSLSGPKFISGIVFAQLIFFIALLGPAIIGIGVKVQQIVPGSEKHSAAA